MPEIPTPEDVAAHIEKYGQWGALPKVERCSECNWVLTDNYVHVCHAGLLATVLGDVPEGLR